MTDLILLCSLFNPLSVRLCYCSLRVPQTCELLGAGASSIFPLGVVYLKHRLTGRRERDIEISDVVTRYCTQGPSITCLYNSETTTYSNSVSDIITIPRLTSSSLFRVARPTTPTSIALQLRVRVTAIRTPTSPSQRAFNLLKCVYCWCSFVHCHIDEMSN
ncbi:hypothetical protein EDB86DRAFT_1518313 [Lactarius hatsudake]|nr:hypothetical protein EDB86DRAFT_1518313 [Lactarius hatsudake]